MKSCGGSIRARIPTSEREILEGILEKHGDRPLAPIAAWCLAIVLADAHASQVEVRSAADRAIRLAARYGSEMELAAVHRVADHLVASEILPDLALDYARKADAMLQPSDPVALQTAVLKNLASALRRAGRMEETKAVEDRLSRIDGLSRRRQRSSSRTESREESHDPWKAKSFAAVGYRSRERQGR